MGNGTSTVDDTGSIGSRGPWNPDDVEAYPDRHQAAASQAAERNALLDQVLRQNALIMQNLSEREASKAKRSGLQGMAAGTDLDAVSKILNVQALMQKADTDYSKELHNRRLGMTPPDRVEALRDAYARATKLLSKQVRSSGCVFDFELNCPFL